MRRTVKQELDGANITLSRNIREEDGAVYRYTTVTITPTRPKGRKRTVAEPISVGIDIEKLKVLVKSV